MNNFFNNLIKILFGFLGIGYIPKVSEFFAAILTLTLAMQISEENRVIYVVIVISMLILTFTFLFKKFFEQHENTSKIVLNRVTGILITMASPFILYTYEWLILSFLLYFTFLKIKIFDIYIKKIKSEWLKFIFKDIFSGCLSLVCLNLIFAGYELFLLIKLYLNR